MSRGITPRQPAKTGRQEGIRKAASKKAGVLRTPRTGESARPHVAIAATAVRASTATARSKQGLQSHGA